TAGRAQRRGLTAGGRAPDTGGMRVYRPRAAGVGFRRLLARGPLREGTGPDEGATSCGAYAHRLTTVKPRGGRVDWSRANGLVAYDRLGDDGFFDVYTMAIDGSRDTCLTCGKAGLPQRQNG